MAGSEVLTYIIEPNVWHRDFAKGLHHVLGQHSPWGFYDQGFMDLKATCWISNSRRTVETELTYSLLALDLVSSLIPIISWVLTLSILCHIQRKLSNQKVIRNNPTFLLVFLEEGPRDSMHNSYQCPHTCHCPPNLCIHTLYPHPTKTLRETHFIWLLEPSLSPSLY